MRYVDGDGREFELPKLTVSLGEAIAEACSPSRPIRERAALQLGVCVECLGADYVRERCDGETLEDMDVSKLTSLTLALKAAYDAPAAEAAAEAVKAQLDAITPLIEAYKAVSELPKAKSRQGFTMVR
jgi:hypothetical protein